MNRMVWNTMRIRFSMPWKESTMALAHSSWDPEIPFHPTMAHFLLQCIHLDQIHQTCHNQLTMFPASTSRCGFALHHQQLIIPISITTINCTTILGCRMVSSHQAAHLRTSRNGDSFFQTLDHYWKVNQISLDVTLYYWMQVSS